MLVETPNGGVYKVLTTAKNKETGLTDIIIEKNGIPEILTEPVKRLIFETLIEMIKNALYKLFKFKTS